MPLEQRDKELAAIGASIGTNCRPCIEHHVAAGREAGLTQEELDDAVATAHAVRGQAVEFLEARIAVLLGHRATGAEPAPVALSATSSSRELVALGVSVGANAHGLLQLHVRAALQAGLEAHQIKSALKMAGYVQQHAASITAEEVARVLAEQVGTPTPTAATPRQRVRSRA
jgi:AhpD family alkylhydroperoxidase